MRELTEFCDDMMKPPLTPYTFSFLPLPLSCFLALLYASEGSSGKAFRLMRNALEFGGTSRLPKSHNES